MNRFSTLLIGVLLTLLCSSQSAGAESSLRLPSELSGTKQVMKLIQRVNVSRTEQKAKQGVSDILDVKSQIYSQNSLLQSGGTGLTVSGARFPQRDTHLLNNMPVARYRTPYKH